MSTISITNLINHWIDSRSSEIVETTCQFLRIASVAGEPGPDAPFGDETRKALRFMLDWMKTQGMPTRMLDGYAAHGEWLPEGCTPDAEIIGVLAHVDVVPPGTGWSHPPFGGEIVNSRIVGRGAIDDKGPAIAAMYALAALKSCKVDGTKRVRLILGADEETDFRCVEHYFRHEEMPVFGFTPDAFFPIVYAEKGILDVAFSAPLPAAETALHLLSLSGGLRPNMVPDSAVAVLTHSKQHWAPVRARLESVVGITTRAEGDGSLHVHAAGRSAHGSQPQVGVNAIGLLCDALLLLDFGPKTHTFLHTLASWSSDTTGAALYVQGEDDVAGSLTSNVGTVFTVENSIQGTINIRYPVTWSCQHVLDRLQPAVATAGFHLTTWSDLQPLYVPVEDPSVQVLLDAHRAVTGRVDAPMTIGGGTYARALTKGVAFGPESHGGAGGAHEADESISVDQLIECTKIYALALMNLVQS